MEIANADRQGRRFSVFHVYLRAMKIVIIGSIGDCEYSKFKIFFKFNNTNVAPCGIGIRMKLYTNLKSYFEFRIFTTKRYYSNMLIIYTSLICVDKTIY